MPARLSTPIRLTHTEPLPGAYRSYAIAYPAALGHYTVSMVKHTKRTSKGSWQVDCARTGMRTSHWSQREAVQHIWKLNTPPRDAEERFLVLPREVSSYDRDDCVLWDRLTGRWWTRRFSDALHTDIHHLAILSDVMSDASEPVDGRPFVNIHPAQPSRYDVEAVRH